MGEGSTCLGSQSGAEGGVARARGEKSENVQVIDTTDADALRLSAIHCVHSHVPATTDALTQLTPPMSPHARRPAGAAPDPAPRPVPTPIPLLNACAPAAGSGCGSCCCWRGGGTASASATACGCGCGGAPRPARRRPRPRPTAPQPPAGPAARAGSPPPGPSAPAACVAGSAHKREGGAASAQAPTPRPTLPLHPPARTAARAPRTARPARARPGGGRRSRRRRRRPPPGSRTGQTRCPGAASCGSPWAGTRPLPCQTWTSGPTFVRGTSE